MDLQNNPALNSENLNGQTLKSQNRTDQNASLNSTHKNTQYRQEISSAPKKQTPTLRVSGSERVVACHARWKTDHWTNNTAHTTWLGNNGLGSGNFRDIVQALVLVLQPFSFLV